MPRGLPRDPAGARPRGRKAILADPVDYRGGLVERRHKEWIDANGGIAAVRRLVDAAIGAAENAKKPPPPAEAREGE